MYETEINSVWILDSKEKEFINKKYSDNRYISHRLAYAFSMRYFDINTKYPSNDDIIPEEIIELLAKQLNCAYKNLEEFDWESRTMMRYRAEIRKFYGFRKPVTDDVKPFKLWLLSDISSTGATIRQSSGSAYKYFKNNKIEPFKRIQLDRHIRSAHMEFEDALFNSVLENISDEIKESMDDLISVDDIDDFKTNRKIQAKEIKLRHLKQDQAGLKIISIQNEISKLIRISKIAIENKSILNTSRKIFMKYHDRVIRDHLRDVKRHPEETRYAEILIFCHIKKQKILDSLTDSLIKTTHKCKFKAEARTNDRIVKEVKKINGKFDILFALANASLDNPSGIVKEVIYTEVDKEILQSVVDEFNSKGTSKWYNEAVKEKMRISYSKYQRRIIMPILQVLTFKSTNNTYTPILMAIAFILKNKDIEGKHYPNVKEIPIKNVIPKEWMNSAVEVDNESKENNSIEKINKMNYELGVLVSLKGLLEIKAIWIEGSYRYKNPDDDLPADFETRKEYYYKLLGLPLKANDFINNLKTTMKQNLEMLNKNIPNNDRVSILENKGGRIKITPYEPQPEPTNISSLKYEINKKWSTVHLIDMLKEADLRINFTDLFDTIATRQNMNRKNLRKKLLLSIFAIGSNIGLKRTSSGNPDVSYDELKYIKRTYMNGANIKSCIIHVIDETLKIRDPRIWGEATTGCASDSTKLSAWDQNLITEWHVRYRGPGVMVYWHVDKNATCIHSQLQSCSSSEVASMIHGVLHHCTKMKVNKSYVDSHGKSTIGFAFSNLLSLDLLPRIKGINKQKLNIVEPKTKSDYPNLSSILATPIKWNLIQEQYNEMVKYAVALKLGTAETEVILKRFRGANNEHPVFKALQELGSAIRTIFVCRYAISEELRIEINEALNVVERLNGIMDFIFYGKLGEISSNKSTEQELSVLCLHLLQACMGYINTLMVQNILKEKSWENRLTVEDKRALSTLFHLHINPYGIFPLDLDDRIQIEREKI